MISPVNNPESYIQAVRQSYVQTGYIQLYNSNGGCSSKSTSTQSAGGQKERNKERDKISTKIVRHKLYNNYSKHKSSRYIQRRADIWYLQNYWSCLLSTFLNCLSLYKKDVDYLRPCQAHCQISGAPKINYARNRAMEQLFPQFQQHNRKSRSPASVGWAISLSRLCKTLINSSELKLPSRFASKTWKIISTTFSVRETPHTWHWTGHSMK